MNRRDFVVSTFTCAVGLAAAPRLFGQPKTSAPDLAALADGKGLTVTNRTVSSFSDGAKKGLRFNEAPNDGVALVTGLELANGAIEVDIKGKDVQGQSFVGVAFHAVDGTTYDGVYFRPFNFKTEDAARRLRSVQYHSNPMYPWQKLREAHPGKYEKPVNPVPDPNGWFHARVVIASPKVSVFVDGATEPCLVVDQLSDRKKGLVGLWVGNGSGGDFANLKVVPA